MHDAFDEMEANLHRIRGVATAASMVIEMELGCEAPANVLDNLLAVIHHLAELTETTRAATLRTLAIPI